MHNTTAQDMFWRRLTVLRKTMRVDADDPVSGPEHWRRCSSSETACRCHAEGVAPLKCQGAKHPKV